MEEILLSAVGQELTCTNISTLNIVGDTIGQYEATVTLDSWWDGYLPIVQFTKYNIVHNRPVIDGKCGDFDAVLSGDGTFNISIFAINAAGDRKTTNSISITVNPSGINDSGTLYASVDFNESILSVSNPVLINITTGIYKVTGKIYYGAAGATTYSDIGSNIGLLTIYNNNDGTYLAYISTVYGSQQFTQEGFVVNEFENIENKTNVIDSSSSTNDYPSAYAAYLFGRHEPTLINTITTSDNTASSIEITLDSASVSFQLKNHITIYAEIPQTTYSNHYFVKLNSNYATTVYDGISSTQKVYSKIEMLWNGREWSAYSNVSAAIGAGSATTRTPALYNAVNQVISSIIITTNDVAKTFPTGTIIKVYGERY